jgi:hypothetical protein
VVIAKAKAFADVLDSKPYVQHDPIIGYRYIANANLELPRPGGGKYHFQTNVQGIRSAKNYTLEKPPGTTRIILCGDSMPGGQFVSNDQRLSEQLERMVPKLEVINISLEGSGTDQQLLLYEDTGQRYEHDLVLLMPFLSNLRRNMVAAREAIDAHTGQVVLRGKPRFDLVGGELVLCNVPVPREIPAKNNGAIETDSNQSSLSRVKTILSTMPGAPSMKRIAYFLLSWEPFPEFRDENSSEWILMRAIVRRFKRSAGDRPLVIAPTFYDSYVRYRMSRAYWQRFSSLESIAGVHVIDLLPRLKALGKDAIKCFQVPYDVHFSSYGHLMLAHILKSELGKRGLLSG